jgi:excisionase family DNA binding protein
MQIENSLKLSLRPHEAAKAIGVSARTLWALTKKGEVPHFRIGRSVLYPVESLRDWLQERAGGRGALNGIEEKRQGVRAEKVAA